MNLLALFANEFLSQKPNPMLNPAPFSPWTLRDTAAQRRLVLRS